MPTIEVTDEQLAEIKKRKIIRPEDLKEVKSYEDLVGNQFLFRTVTYHCVGKVVRFVGRFAVLKDASWIADTGRFTQAIKDGTLNEVEPVGEMFVNLDTVVDMFPWRHKLPTEQK